MGDKLSATFDFLLITNSYFLLQIETDFRNMGLCSS